MLETSGLGRTFSLVPAKTADNTGGKETRLRKIYLPVILAAESFLSWQWDMPFGCGRFCSRVAAHKSQEGTAGFHTKRYLKKEKMNDTIQLCNQLEKN